MVALAIAALAVAVLGIVTLYDALIKATLDGMHIAIEAAGCDGFTGKAARLIKTSARFLL